MRSLFLASMMLAAATIAPRALAEPIEIEIEVKSELVPVRPLHKGEFSWAPEIAPKGKVIVVIDLAGQLAHVYRDGHEIGRATVSTGKSGQETPPGGSGYSKRRSAIIRAATASRRCRSCSD